MIRITGERKGQTFILTRILLSTHVKGTEKEIVLSPQCHTDAPADPHQGFPLRDWYLSEKVLVV